MGKLINDHKRIFTRSKKSIVLTEDWLKKLGFKCVDLKPHNPSLCLYLGSNGIIDKFLTWDKIQNEYYYAVRFKGKTKGLNLFVDFKYIHQIQELYFALTGNILYEIS